MVTTYTYDEYDNLATLTDPEGRISHFPDYDEAGNLLTVEDGRNNQKHLEYDAAGNRSSSINALLKEF